VVDLVPDAAVDRCLFSGACKQGETYASSGFARTRKIIGFLRDAASQKRRKFARNVRGWIHSGPDRCGARLSGFWEFRHASIETALPPLSDGAFAAI
jgi:hypothetical protein